MIPALGLLYLLGVGCDKAGPETGDTAACLGPEILVDGECVAALCGEDTWGLNDPEGADAFVIGESKDVAVDPTRTFTTLQEAVDSLESGGTVLIAAGTYDGSVTLDRSWNEPPQILGRCADLTTLRSSDEVVVRVYDTATLSGVRVEGGSSAAIGVSGGSLTLTDAEVVGDGNVDIAVGAGQLVVERVHLDERVELEGTFGLQVTLGGVVSGSDLSVTPRGNAGIYADGSTVEVDGVTLEVCPEEGGLGVGLNARDESTVTLTDASWTTCGADLLLAQEQGTTVTVETFSAEWDQSSSVANNYGVEARDGASLVLREGTLSGLSPIAIAAHDAATEIELHDVTIEDTRPDATGAYGYGLHVADQARVTVEGATVSGSTAFGVVVTDAETSLDAYGLEVRGTAPAEGQRSAAGMLVTRSSVELSDTTVESNQGPGIVVDELGYAACLGCTISGNQFAGVVVREAYFEASSIVVEENVAVDSEPGGMGVYAVGGDTDYGSWVWIGGESVVGPHELSALYFSGTGGFALQDSTFYGSDRIEIEGFGVQVHGNALVATDGIDAWDSFGFDGLLLTDNVFLGYEGPAIFLDRASAYLSGNTYDGEAAAIWQQNCDGSVTSPPIGYTEAGDASICPEYDELFLTPDFSYTFRELPDRDER